MNKLIRWLLIVNNILDGYSLANHRWFQKISHTSPCQTFPLYVGIANEALARCMCGDQG